MKGFEIVRMKPNAQNIEMWMAYDKATNEAIGHIFMKIEAGSRIKFLDAWVDESHRRKGIYRSLWEARWECVEESYKGYTVYAWCKDSSLPLLIEKGFEPGEIVTYVEKKIE
jgi:hypothetical protein